MTNIPEFYVYRPTRAEVKELLKRMVANGIAKWDGLKRKKLQTGWDDYYEHNDYGCWGHNSECGTYACGVCSNWARRDKKLTMSEVRELLPLPSDNKEKQQ